MTSQGEKMMKRGIFRIYLNMLPQFLLRILGNPLRVLLPAALLAGLAVFLGCQRPPIQRLVLYCSQDQEYAEGILVDFAKKTGIQVELRGDTEADKSVSLYEALVRESAQPRCDVFWCNEPVLMQRLAQRGLLEPYASPAAAGFPAWTHSTDRTWQAFAARARILLVNQSIPPEQAPQRLSDLLQPVWRQRYAMAKPFYGTTATHMACLWQLLGPEPARKLFTGLAGSAVVLPGNRDVALAVAEGQVPLGLTDTDDAREMITKGKPVRIVYLDQPEPGTLFLPNTLGLIKNGPHPALGQALIDFLLAPEVEMRLANGPSTQIPLNPAVKLENFPLATPATIKAMPVDYAVVASRWEAVQTALRAAFRP
jgi:iron(III) transport system substrate-binding protein